MSDNEYSDEDEYLYSDEFPYNEAEDLAEHTMHSPVWLNYDPAYDTASHEGTSDWEYYSDEYWDQDSPKKKQKTGDDKGSTQRSSSTKGKRKTKESCSTDEIPVLSLPEPPLSVPMVVWKSKEQLLESLPRPVYSEGQGEKVSLLKDWRQRFKKTSEDNQATAWPDGVGEGASSPGHQDEYMLLAPATTQSILEDLPSRSKSSLSPNNVIPPESARPTLSSPITSPKQTPQNLQPSPTITNTQKRKSKAEPPSCVPEAKKQRGRPKKTSLVESSEPKAGTDHNTLPSNRPQEPKKGPAAIPPPNSNMSEKPSFMNGTASTRGKRKGRDQDPEDEVEGPLPKRGNPVHKADQESAKKSRKPPVSGRVTRKTDR